MGGGEAIGYNREGTNKEREREKRSSVFSTYTGGTGNAQRVYIVILFSLRGSYMVNITSSTSGRSSISYKSKQGSARGRDFFFHGGRQRITNLKNKNSFIITQNAVRKRPFEIKSQRSRRPRIRKRTPHV